MAVTVALTMNSPRAAFTKIALLAALLFAVVDSAHAVRPYTSRVSEATYYRRPTNTSILGYTIPPRKSVVQKRAIPYTTRQQSLVPLKSWSGLGAAERRAKGDHSAYGELRSRSVTGRDPAVRHSGFHRLHVGTSPLSVR